MTREEMITNKTKEYLSEYFDFAFQDILKDFEENSEMLLKKILWDFEVIFQRIKKEQELRKKGAIHYIVISFIYSSLETETYELQIEVFDERLYFDKNPVIGKTESYILKKYFNKEWKQYIDFMKKDILQLKLQEIYPFRKIFICKYERLIKEILSQYLPYILKLKTYSEIQRSEDINIIYGEYYTSGIRLNEVGED